MNFDDEEDAFVLVTPLELGMNSRDTSFSVDDETLLNVSLDSTSSFRPLGECDTSVDEDQCGESDLFDSHSIRARVATLAVPSHFRLQPRFNACRVKLI
jgi:hypothetical protein